MRSVLHLVKEPWIPVLDGGRLREVSPLEAISRPGLLPALHPYEEVPVLRFLLYLLAWAFQGEEAEEVALLPGEELALRVEERTGEFSEAFRLGGEDFFLRGEGEVPWEEPEVLRPDWPSRGGETALLTRPRGVPGPLRLSPAEAARALLAHLAYAPSGLYRKLGVASLPACPLAQGVTFHALGKDLGATLRLNLLVPPRLEAPWETPTPRPAPLGLYLWPARRYALRFEEGRLEGVRVYPGLPVPALPDPMKAHREEGGRLLELRGKEEEGLEGAVLPALSAYAPPQVLEAAASREDLLGPYALRAVAQVADQSRVPALLAATFPALTSPREAFRLRLGEAAWALGRLLREAEEALGGGRAARAFLHEAEAAVLEAPGEEEGRALLWRLFLRHLDGVAASRVRRNPALALEARRRARRRGEKVLGTTLEEEV